MPKKNIVFDILIPVVILMAFTIVFWMTNLDIAIEKLFFVEGEGWIHKGTYPWTFFDRFGPMPAFILTGVSLGILVASCWNSGLVRYRKIALFFVLLLAIGPGLVVNSLFKTYWGRPRPKYIQEFNGPTPFLYVWQKGTAGNGHSFPSGHASTGFFLLSPFFILRKYCKKWAVLVLLFGLSSGCIIGFARMIQGRHFPSDVIWAGGFVYLCGLGLYYLLGLHRNLFVNNCSSRL